MFTRVNQALGIALAVQVGLAAVVWWPRGEATVEATAVMTMDAAAVTRVEITGKPMPDQAAKPVVLTRRGPADWVISSAFDYPASSDKVDDLLETLTGLVVRNPIATNATRHAQLKVGDTEYGRRVTVEPSRDNHARR